MSDDRPTIPEPSSLRAASAKRGEGRRAEEHGAGPPGLRTEDRRRDVALALGAVAALACAIGLAFQPSRAFGRVAFIALATALVVLAVFAVARTRARGEAATLRPRGGDLSLGAVVAATVYALALGAVPIVFPRGTAAEASFLMAYVPLIDPLQPDARHATAAACGLLVALEEVTLRGLVQPALTRVLGVIPGWLVTAALDTAAWIPAALLLADSRVGFNAVFVAFAAITATATGWLYVRTGRVPPAALARALAAWALIEFPIWSL